MKCVMCRHWSLDGKELKHQHLTCNTRPDGYGFCLLSEYGNEGLTPQEAFAQDASDYAAVLITSPRFGCNQFLPSTDVIIKSDPQ